MDFRHPAFYREHPPKPGRHADTTRKTHPDRPRPGVSCRDGCRRASLIRLGAGSLTGRPMAYSTAGPASLHDRRPPMQGRRRSSRRTAPDRDENRCLPTRSTARGPLLVIQPSRSGRSRQRRDHPSKRDQPSGAGTPVASRDLPTGFVTRPGHETLVTTHLTAAAPHPAPRWVEPSGRRRGVFRDGFRHCRHPSR